MARNLTRRSAAHTIANYKYTLLPTALEGVFVIHAQHARIRAACSFKGHVHRIAASPG
jgi:hypothetical protein